MPEEVMSRKEVLVGGAALAIGALAASCSRGDSMSLSTGAASTTTPFSVSEPAAATSTAVRDSTATTLSTTTVPGADARGLAGVDFAGLDAFLDANNTRGFAIVEHGVTIHEWYRDEAGFGRDVASAQKSVLSLLIGRAITDGFFDLDTRIDDVLGTQWTGHGMTADITVRHLLTMTSGLDDQLDVVADPGVRWIYSGAFAQLFDVLTEATGRELNDVASEWLFAPAGASNAVFYERRAGLGSTGLYATIDDLLGVGRAILESDALGLDDDWLDFSFTPLELNGGYGAMWWLNGGASYLLPGQIRPSEGVLIEGAPDDLVGALGKDDQKLYIAPSWSLVVARLGDKAEAVSSAARSGFDTELWTQLRQLRG